jgi:hypothetical protein
VCFAPATEIARDPIRSAACDGSSEGRPGKTVSSPGSRVNPLRPKARGVPAGEPSRRSAPAQWERCIGGAGWEARARRGDQGAARGVRDGCRAAGAVPVRGAGPGRVEPSSSRRSTASRKRAASKRWSSSSSRARRSPNGSRKARFRWTRRF